MKFSSYEENFDLQNPRRNLQNGTKENSKHASQKNIQKKKKKQFPSFKENFRDYKIVEIINGTRENNM